jgi:hypothetical protein
MFVAILWYCFVLLYSVTMAVNLALLIWGGGGSMGPGISVFGELFHLYYALIVTTEAPHHPHS